MKKTILSSLFLSLVLAGCGKEEPIQQTSSSTDSSSHSLSATTGLPVSDSSKESPYFSIMIENSVPSRPHSGLASADVVYEMKVEYQITRFLALFHDEIPDSIGPVRSARHYFLPLAEDLNSPYIHFGGSTMAYENLNSLSVSHIDGITQGDYFSRDQSRKAPHNAYLHPEQLPDFPENNPDLPFSFGQPPSGEQVSEISFAYNNFTHIQYLYDADKKVYIRHLEESLHQDRETGETIAPANVVILQAPHTKLHTKQHHIDIDFSSGGTALYYSGGEKRTGSWKNENQEVLFLDDNGQSIVLSPGKTWIQVVEDTIAITEK